MALVVDTTVRFMNPPSGQNFTFKLSKPLNQLTIDDIKSQDAYVGFTNFAINTIGEGVLSQGSPVNNPNHCYMWATDDSSLYSDINVVGHWCNPPAFPDGVYMRNILVYAPLSISNNGSFIKADSASRIVIDITPDANTSMQKLAIGSDGRLVCWYSNDTLSENRVDNYYYIYPAILFEINDTTYIYTQELSPRWASFYINSILDQGFNSNTARVNFDNESYHRLAYGWTVGATSIGENFFTKFDENRQIENYNINGHTVTFKVNVGASNYHWRVSESMTDNADKTVTKQYYANTGFRFKIDNVWYKPIITGGIVTGYTDDMTVQSEWDTWTKATGHNVPSGGGGGGSGDDAESETFGWGGNEVGGMARYYLLTSAEMESLADFMSDPLWTIDYRNCIISMFVVPNSGGLFDAVEPTTIKFKLDDNQKVDTGVSAKRIIGVIPNSSATIEIPRMNDNFLDFEPYSKYLLYIPFCGVIQLPDYVAGKEINVKLYPDIPTCSCTAIVTSDDRKIATVRGNIGSSIPVTSDGSGIKTAAIINSMANGIVGVGEALMGGSTGNVGMVAGGVAQALGSVLSTTVTLGQAFGYSVGSSGDTSFFGAGTRCEYYIAYPKWNNPDTSETNIYGHTFGFVVNKRGKLKDFEGFTVCDNPHVYGFSCTAAEKEEIEMLLRQGIIIHQPSE